MGTLAATAVVAAGSSTSTEVLSSSSSASSSSTPGGLLLPGILARLDVDVDVIEVDQDGTFQEERQQQRSSPIERDILGRTKRVRNFIDRIVSATAERKSGVDKNGKKPRFSIVLDSEEEEEEEEESYQEEKEGRSSSNLSLKATTVPHPSMVNVQHHMDQNGVRGVVPKQRKPLPALSPIQYVVSDGGGGKIMHRVQVVPTTSSPDALFPSIASFFDTGVSSVPAGHGSSSVPIMRRRKAAEPIQRRRSVPLSSSFSDVAVIPCPTTVRSNKPNDGSFSTQDEERVVLLEGMMQPGKKNHNKIKRPLNAFMVWSKLQRRKIMEDDSTVHHSVISKQLGAGWKALSEEERRPYYEEAQRLGKLHNRLYPDYKYRPRRKQNTSSSTPQLPSSSSSVSAISTIRPSSVSPPYSKGIIPFIPSLFFSHESIMDLSMKSGHSGQSHSSDESNIEVTPIIYQDQREEEYEEEEEEEELPLDMSCSSAMSYRSESPSPKSSKSWTVIHDESRDNPDEDEDRLFIDES